MAIISDVLLAEKPKEKTKAKQRYLKQKKQRRKNRKAPAADAQIQTAEDVISEDESNQEKEGGVSITRSKEIIMEIESGDVTKEKRPKKRRKIIDEAEDVEMGDAITTQVTTTKDMSVLAVSRSPTPPASLPSFPRPARPDAPSKSVLALQGLDQALVDAEVVDSATLLSIPEDGAEDGGTRLHEKTRRRLKELGITELFAVQTALLPFLLPTKRLARSLYLPYDPPRDVCVSAPTGSGKTLAYILPIIEVLSQRIVTRLRALVVLPTRDLVSQVRETFEAVGKGRGLKVAAVTGQHSFAHEQAQLVLDNSTELQGGSSKVDILICTPGRLMDHLSGTRNFSLQHLRFLVIDEADRLLAQSFQDWLVQVLTAIRSPILTDPVANTPSTASGLPYPDALAPSFHRLLPYPTLHSSFVSEKKESSCQKLLFSATLTRDPGKIVSLDLRDPKYFIVQSLKKNEGDIAHAGAHNVVMEEFSMPATLIEHMIVCESSKKPLVLFHLVHAHNISNALVFTKSAESTTRLLKLFDFFQESWAGNDKQRKEKRIVARAYSSDLVVADRKSILEKFRLQEIQILVCSDLISRGIDISHVSHVVSYDAPVDIRKYIHRNGRTARAGRAGDAWTLVEEQEARHFKAMLRAADHLDQVKRMRVEEKELEHLLPHYEVALSELKGAYVRYMTKSGYAATRFRADRRPELDRSTDTHVYAPGKFGPPTLNVNVHPYQMSHPDSRTSRSNESTAEAKSADGLEKSESVQSRVPVFHQRSLLTRVPFTSTRIPPPPKASVDESDLIPEASAHWMSILTFSWITPLLGLGYARPLEAPDLYKLQDDRAAAYIADRILDSFEARRKKADEYNLRLANGEIKAGWRVLWWSLRGKKQERERKWREVDGKRKPSLTWAMNDSVKWWFWSGGILKVIGDTAQITSPLLVKAIITFATKSYINHRVPGESQDVPSIGKGIGLAIGLLALQLIASFCTHHFFYRSTSTGVLLRGGLITAIYSRSLRLTARARSTLTNGKLVNHISTDVSRIDFCCGFFHMAWASPIQMTICLILLLINLGPSALAGFAFFILATPVQTLVMKRLFLLRKQSMQWTDKRAKLLQELLGGMKVIKFFAWEVPFLKRIFEYRKKEMSYVRSLLLIRSGNNAVALSMPVLASVVAFVTYSLTGHDLNPANIFSSLTLFTLLRLPLMFLPIAFSSIADASNATERLYGVFEAETLEGTYVQENDLDVGIEVKGASWSWDSPPPELEEAKKRRGPHGGSKGAVLERAANAAAASRAAEKVKADEENVFKLTDITISIPRGSLVAVCGPVGTGKSSLLQGLIGEMRKTAGTVKFGGTVGYCPQSAWIQNATIRENVCFGRPFEEDRYWRAIQDACLLPDLDMLPHGDLTEVGEKGISLSGGQKQRINICRAIYSNTDIQLFDDPLSALDAHVGKAVFTNVLQNTLSGKTRVLVTHALHFLPQVDYIYTIVDGRVAERGTYSELMKNDGAFSKFVTEFGSKESSEEKEEEAVEEGGPEMKPETRKHTVQGAALMQVEERNTGAIDGAVYKAYLAAGNGLVVMPLLLMSLVLIQGFTVMSSYWLVYWQERKWPQPSGFYMGIYAGLGVGQALAFFFMGAMFAMLTYFASQSLHRRAIGRVMNAPMSFFETTPLGRIMNRFSKDIDTIDNLLGDSLRMFASTLSSIIGAIILISIIVPWFLVAVFAIVLCYIYAAAFYRASARELKRLDAVLRSSLYSHFSESLSGLATIRAYGEAERFRLENEHRVNVENRAYWLTVTNQRWLGIRLDFLGSLLTLSVSLLVVGTRFTISPSQTGVALSYILSVQQAFGWMVRQSAEVENNMNSVERTVHYATEIEQEPPHDAPGSKPPGLWPSKGRVELKNVVFKYRPELPPVLKDISMTVEAGEKIGIVGRTGAGKSSVMTALFRLVELSSGSILIDGVDISQVGLTDLRSGLSIIPQDPLLFSGTLRSNLDPFGLHNDARLWDALRRSYLVEQTKGGSLDPPDEDIPSGAHTPMGMNRLTLDSVVEDEGQNLSLGQRSLVSLARALVKDTKVLILGEATASVDYETDRNIQSTIAHEFRDRTILCIAHRLRTIISYDRICVLDAGKIAEFDTPINLYERHDTIFRGMCERSSISSDDIKMAVKTRKEELGY